MNPIKKIVAAVKRAMETNTLEDIPSDEKAAYLAAQQAEIDALRLITNQQ